MDLTPQQILKPVHHPRSTLIKAALITSISYVPPQTLSHLTCSDSIFSYVQLMLSMSDEAAHKGPKNKEIKCIKCL